jgi:hypothetical protein
MNIKEMYQEWINKLPPEQPSENPHSLDFIYEVWSPKWKRFQPPRWKIFNWAYNINRKLLTNCHPISISTNMIEFGGVLSTPVNEITLTFDASIPYRSKEVQECADRIDKAFNNIKEYDIEEVIGKKIEDCFEVEKIEHPSSILLPPFDIEEVNDSIKEFQNEIEKIRNLKINEIDWKKVNKLAREFINYQNEIWPDGFKIKDYTPYNGLPWGPREIYKAARSHAEQDLLREFLIKREDFCTDLYTAILDNINNSRKPMRGASSSIIWYEDKYMVICDHCPNKPDTIFLGHLDPGCLQFNNCARAYHMGHIDGSIEELACDPTYRGGNRENFKEIEEELCYGYEKECD